ACVDQIKSLLAQPGFRETAESRAMLANAALEARIRAALKTSDATGEVGITVHADGGKVVLEGVVVDEDEHSAAHRGVQAVQGVSAVESRLKEISAHRREGE